MKTKFTLLLLGICLTQSITAQAPSGSTLSTTEQKAIEYFLLHHPNPPQADYNEFVKALKNDAKISSGTSQQKLAQPPSVQSGCINTDFESGSLIGWTTSTGYNPLYMSSGCCPTPGGAQIITSGIGVDPCGGFPVVCPGGNFSMMLGDNQVGGHADRIEQTFQVTSNNTNYSYKYAVVLQDPGHSVADQPSFQIEMLDGNGFQIPCTFYQVSAGQNIPGFQNSTNCAGVVFKPWTTVSVDLSTYVGQTVTIRFTTYDCALGGHYGYAYIDGSCGIFKISQSGILCNNSSTQLCAPAGYNTYSWSGPGVNNVSTQCLTVTTAGVYSVQVTSVTGCSSPVIDYTVTMNPAPNANFNPSNAIGCNTFISFNNTSSNGGGPYTSYWTFGDGDTSTVNPPSHTYGGYGTYTVTLYVYAQNGCMDTTTHVVTINPPPAPGMSYTGICEGTAFNFSGTVSGNQQNATWLWNFGNNVTSTQQNPSYTFPSWGSFPVTLSVTNNGCTTSLTQNVSVQPDPVIAASSNSVCLGSATIFTNNSSIPLGTIASWGWDFNGDGVIDNTTQSPNYVFPGAGTFTVNLSATSSYGCVSTGIVPVTVYALPAALFTTQNNCLNTVSTFSNNSTAPSGSFITQYYWDFGDGSFSQLQQPTHTYLTAASYNVKLAVTTNNTCVDTYTAPIGIYALPIVSFTANSICENQATQFAGSISGIQTNTQWQWNFGNNATSVLQNPSYHFPGWGTYPVSLAATDNNGCSNSVTQNINIQPAPVISVGANAVCSGSSTTFTNNSTIPSGSITGWAWDFNGDGIIDNTTANPSYNFPGTGTYTVAITETSNFGCISTGTVQVTVNGLPVANFSTANNCLHTSSVFTNNSTAPSGSSITQNIWTFGNGNTSSAQQPQYNYPVAGTYLVTLVLTTNQGCTSVTANPITIYPSPLANFTSKPVCANQNMHYTDQSSISSGSITSWKWDFTNDGITDANIQNPVYTFTAGGTYNSKLTAISNFSCADSVIKPVTVYFNPVANFNAATVCFGKPVQFTDASSNQSGYITVWDWDFTSDGVIDNFSQNTSNTYTASGLFLVTLQVQNNFGCINLIKKPVRVNPTPMVNISATHQSGCQDDMCVGMINNSTITGGSVATWHWNFGDNTSSNQNSPTHCFHAGTFTVSLTAVSDSGCTASQTMPGSILVYPKPQAGFAFTNTNLDVLDATTDVMDGSHGATGYVYFISDGTTINGQPNFNHTFPNENPATYTVVQIVTNSFGCKDTILKVIEVKPGFTFYIPNAFSPNGDGTNDIFKGTGIGIKTFTLWVFDRWGNLVFMSNDLEKGWDGTWKGNGGEVSLQDVFVWKVELRDDNNKSHAYDGTVSLIK